MKNNPPPDSVVLSFDEKGRIAVKQFEGYKWLQDKSYYMPDRQKVRGVMDLIAARNLHNGDFIYKFYSWKNSFIVVDMFEYLLQCYPGKHLYIIIDNWSAHKSNSTKAFVDTHERITLVYLPYNASWLNDIERDFSIIERCVLRNSNFSSVREAIAAITRFVENDPSFNGKSI